MQPRGSHPEALARKHPVCEGHRDAGARVTSQPLAEPSRVPRPVSSSPGDVKGLSHAREAAWSERGLCGLCFSTILRQSLLRVTREHAQADKTLLGP